jgi:hypothetical protein
LFIEEDMVAQSILLGNLQLFKIDKKSEEILSQGEVFIYIRYGTVQYNLPQDIVTMCLMERGCISC